MHSLFIFTPEGDVFIGVLWISVFTPVVPEVLYMKKYAAIWQLLLASKHTH